MTSDDDTRSAVDAAVELERLTALPLDRRAAALAETARRLEAELDSTEATRATGTGLAAT
jgi:hypothetical protein